MSSEGGGRDTESQEELAKAQRDLQAATNKVTELTKDLEASTYSTETGVKANDLLSRWLEQLLLLEKTKAEIERVQAQVELTKIQAEVAKVNKELVHWQAVAEQAKTCDIVDNGEETYSGDSTNIHGVTRQILEDHKATRDNTNKTTLLNFAEKVVLGPYGIIESSEGVGASYYGLNGANAISIINAVRKAYGVPELNTDKYSGDHKEYMDTYAPDVTLESED